MVDNIKHSLYYIKHLYQLRLLFNFFFFYYSCFIVYAYHDTHVEVRGQLVGIALFCIGLGDQTHQAFDNWPLSTESSL